jgi:hypothetical protein
MLLVNQVTKVSPDATKNTLDSNSWKNSKEFLTVFNPPQGHTNA